MGFETSALSENATEHSTAHGETFEFRQRLEELYASAPLPPRELMFNLGLYMRSSLLVKFLVMNDLYQRVLSVPGALVEFGVWWGQNLVLLENLRAIHEPFNKQRVVLGFDTFEGYDPASVIESDGSTHYSTGVPYKDYLSELLAIHEGNNAFGHIRGNHQLIAGDVTKTAPRYFDDHPEMLVAFAYFDMGPYEPTVAALRAIKPRLLPGSVILFDELTWAGAPGEAIAFREIFSSLNYSIEKCKLYPSKTIVTLK